MADIAVVGIGNPYRGDDGAGWAVIDALQGKTSGVQLYKSRGEIAELIETFAKATSLYLVDACRMDGPPGLWQRIDAHLQPLPFEDSQTSTHGLSISQAIALAKTLDRLPPRLIIYAINGEHYEIGTALSPPVAEAIDKVAEKILTEEDIRACTKKV